MGYKSPIFSSENLTKAIHRLPLHLRNRFYKFTKDSNLIDGSVNLLIFEKWLDDQIKVCFNPLADIVNKQDLSNKSKLPLSKSYSKLTANSLHISEEIQDEKDQELKSNSNSIVSSSKKTTESVEFKCWLCGNNHRLKECRRFISKSVSDRTQFIKEHKLCWNCLSKKYTVKEYKSKFSCSKDSCNKQHHTLIQEDIKVKQEENVTTNHVSQHEDSRNKTYLQVLNVYISNGQTSKYPNSSIIRQWVRFNTYIK